MSYDNTNTMILFVNDKGDNPKRPDRTGKVNVDGKDYKVSLWFATDESGEKKLDKNGKPMMRGKVEPADEQPQRQAPQRQPAPSFDDGIDF